MLTKSFTFSSCSCECGGGNRARGRVGRFVPSPVAAVPIRVAISLGLHGHDDVATSTFTLTADCGEVTSPLTVPDGYTIEGGGHIITATDPVGTDQFHRWRGDECPRRNLDACQQRHHPSHGFAFHDCAFCSRSAYSLFRSDSSSRMPAAPRPTSLFGTSLSTLAAKPVTGSVPTRGAGQHARSRSPTSP